MILVPIEVREYEATKLRKEFKNQPDVLLPSLKLAPNAIKVVFIAYKDNGYKFFDPHTNCVLKSANVIQWYKDQTITDIISIEALLHDPKPPKKPVTKKKQFLRQPQNPMTEHSYFKLPKENQVHIALPKYAHKFLASDMVPEMYAEAMNGPFSKLWLQAILKEFQSHQENGTWTLTKHPGCFSNILNTKWVFAAKFNVEGTKILKARLVAVGCGDSNNYTIEDTYAPVCPLDIICLVISIAQVYKLKMTTVDVATVFLYGKLDQDIYLRIPEGIELDKKLFAFKLCKATWFKDIE